MKWPIFAQNSLVSKTTTCATLVCLSGCHSPSPTNTPRQISAVEHSLVSSAKSSKVVTASMLKDGGEEKKKGPLILKRIDLVSADDVLSMYEVSPPQHRLEGNRGLKTTTRSLISQVGVKNLPDALELATYDVYWLDHTSGLVYFDVPLSSRVGEIVRGNYNCGSISHIQITRLTGDKVWATELNALGNRFVSQGVIEGYEQALVSWLEGKEVDREDLLPTELLERSREEAFVKMREYVNRQEFLRKTFKSGGGLPNQFYQSVKTLHEIDGR